MTNQSLTILLTFVFSFSLCGGTRSEADELVSVIINGQFGPEASVTILNILDDKIIDVSEDAFRIEMTFNWEKTPDSFLGRGRGWFFGGAGLTTPKIGGFGIQDPRGETFLDVIVDNPSPGLYWFGLDFPENNTGVAGIFDSPVFVDPDSPSTFELTTPESFIFQLDGVEISNGLLFGSITSSNDGLISDIGLIDTIDFRNSLVIGDVNLDGAVNLLDVEPFISQLSLAHVYQYESDANQDGLLNLLDVAAFVSLLSGEPATTTFTSPLALIGDATGSVATEVYGVLPHILRMPDKFAVLLTLEEFKFDGTSEILGTQWIPLEDAVQLDDETIDGFLPFEATWDVPPAAANSSIEACSQLWRKSHA